VNVLHHFGVELWVPELGGRFDPDNDGHWMMLANFGVLSRAERNRTRIRVRNAMRAHAQAGRWLGGRPPYGYRIADAGPHPNPSKAVSGARLHQLEPDPETALVVQRIFRMYLAGSGFKAIATVMTNEGVPSPSAADPSRNTHRPGHAWAFSAIRAILQNPRYLGRHVFGKQAKAEVLLDPDQPALGHVTRMRWQDRSEWLRAADVTHEALVDDTTWRRVQQLIESNGRPSSPTRTTGGASRRSAPSHNPPPDSSCVPIAARSSRGPTVAASLSTAAASEPDTRWGRPDIHPPWRYARIGCSPTSTLGWLDCSHLGVLRTSHDRWSSLTPRASARTPP
jgi:hypothetical protein